MERESRNPGMKTWQKFTVFNVAVRVGIFMITPCIDPLTAILEAGILGEGINGADRSGLY